LGHSESNTFAVAVQCCASPGRYSAAGVTETGTLGASEKRNVDEAQAALRGVESYLPVLLRRLRRHMTIPDGAAVLDVGASQGGYLIALTRLGYQGRGVEISPAAIETGRELSRREGVRTDIVEGRAEELPFEDESSTLCSRSRSWSTWRTRIAS
jgi:SAM-dependent methyltransferase